MKKLKYHNTKFTNKMRTTLIVAYTLLIAELSAAFQVLVLPSGGRMRREDDEDTEDDYEEEETEPVTTIPGIKYLIFSCLLSQSLVDSFKLMSE